MTRNEFNNSINSFGELKDFGNEYDCDLLYNIVSNDSRDEDIDYDIGEYIRDYGWQDIRCFLNDIPTNGEYYYHNSAFDYDVLDDNDFQRLKADVFAWACRCGIFDDEEEQEEVPDEQEEELFEEEDFSISALMSMCGEALSSINETIERQKMDEEMFAVAEDLFYF